MVAKEFIDYVEKFKLTSYTGLEDVADRMSFLVSVLLFMLSAVIVTLKTYVMSPLSCYTPVTPSGSKFDDYLENYCWTEGTYAFLPHEKIPQKAEDWKNYDDLKLMYYQWIPFILGLQAICFYLPRIMWQTFCYNKLGVDLENLVQKADKAKNEDNVKDKTKTIAERIESILYYHRDYRQGKISDARRKLSRMFGAAVPSKRLGTWLVFWYFIMKVVYLVNAFGQLVLIARLFQAKTNFLVFGKDILLTLRDGQNWEESRVFPRVTYCFVDNVRLLGGGNSYSAQCALPQNMINEKLFVVLWLWVFAVAIATIFSLFLWLYRIMSKSRVSFIKKFLKNDDFYDSDKLPVVEKFVSEFLQHDGHLIVHMIYLNSGDVVTTAVVRHLYDIYEAKYITLDLRCDYYYKQTPAIAGYNPDSMAMKLGAPNMATYVHPVPAKPPTAPMEFV